jgi:hypothetical protein
MQKTRLSAAITNPSPIHHQPSPTQTGFSNQRAFHPEKKRFAPGPSEYFSSAAKEAVNGAGNEIKQD